MIGEIFGSSVNFRHTSRNAPQVAAFVDCYMPAYKAYLPGMYSKGPTTAKSGRLLMLEIDENRGLVPNQPACPL